ncbi:hypothetical protein EW145_g5290 [Phellinidium pouzarii]|uniref:Nuclear protein localization protein 4 n=1 Tax=Phellinidium pouzarii TaxID=167371 RepID=A0A4S4L0H0_9AGAM|nr:hypothetical protein EW145_g5290 [Phellinidium pouzarii]
MGIHSTNVVDESSDIRLECPFLSFFVWYRMVDRAFGSQRAARSPLPSWEILKESEGDEETSSGDEGNTDEIVPSPSPGASRLFGDADRVGRPVNTQNRTTQQTSREARPSSNKPSGKGGSTQKSTKTERTVPGMQSIWMAMPLPTQSASQVITESSNSTQPSPSAANLTASALSSTRSSHPDVTAAPFIHASVARKTPGIHRPKATSAAKLIVTPSASSSMISSSTRTTVQPHSRNTIDDPALAFSPTRAEQSKAASSAVSSVIRPSPNPEVKKSSTPELVGDREAADKIRKEFAKVGPSTQPAKRNISSRMPPSTQPASASLSERPKAATGIPATQPNPTKKRRETIATIEISSDEDGRTIIKRCGGRDDPLVIPDSSDESINNSPPAIRRKPRELAPQRKFRRKILPANLKPLDSLKPYASNRPHVIDLVDPDDAKVGSVKEVRPSDSNLSGSQLSRPISTLQGERSLLSGPSSTFIMPMNIVLNENGGNLGHDHDVDSVADIRNGVSDVHISGTRIASSLAPAEPKFSASSLVPSDKELGQDDTVTLLARASKENPSLSDSIQQFQKNGQEEPLLLLAQATQIRRSPVVDVQTEEALLSDDTNEVDILLGANTESAQKADDSGVVETRKTPQAGDHAIFEDPKTPRKPQTLTQQLQQLDLSIVANARGSNTEKSSEQEQDRGRFSTSERTNAIITSSATPTTVQSPSFGKSAGPSRNIESKTTPVTVSNKNTESVLSMMQTSPQPNLPTTSNAILNRRSTSPWSAQVTEPERNMFGFYQSTKGRSQFSQESSVGNKAPISRANVNPKLAMPTPLRAVENNTAKRSISSSRLSRLNLSRASPSSSQTDITASTSDQSSLAVEHKVAKHTSAPQPSHINITQQSTSGEHIKSSVTVMEPGLRNRTLSPTSLTKRRIPDPLPPRMLRPGKQLWKEFRKEEAANAEALTASSSALPPAESRLTFKSEPHMPAVTSGSEPVRITTPGIDPTIEDSDGEIEAREATRKILKLNPNIFGSSAFSPTKAEVVGSPKLASGASPKSAKFNSKSFLDRLLGMHAVSSKLNNKGSSQKRDVVLAGENSASGKKPWLPPDMTILEKDTGKEITIEGLQDILEASETGTTASMEKPNVLRPSPASAAISRLPLVAERHGSRKRSRSQSPKPSKESDEQNHNKEVRSLPKRPRISNEDIVDSANDDTILQRVPERDHTLSTTWRRSRSRSSVSSIDPTDLLDAQTDDGPDSLLEQPRSPVSEITVAVDEIAIVSKPDSYTPPADVERYFLERKYGPVYKRAVDIPKELVNEVNDMPTWSRNPDVLRQVFESVIMTNTTHDEPEAPYIRVINNIDDDPTPPFEFYYTNYLWHGEGVPPPDYDNLQGCTCIGKCNPRSKTCACVKRQKAAITATGHTWDGFVYDKDGHLREHGFPIFECNDACGCTDDCTNRVVQLGRKCLVDIVKTEKKGWGVFAGKKISKGTFIGIYSGELLIEEEAEMRGKVYNKLGRTYLFDIDFYHIPRAEGEESAKYCVDAFHAGNFTRYLNHSCDPNCRINACHINDADVEKALLAMFAERDIDAGEELCFSYLGAGNDEDPIETKAVAGSPGKKAAKSKEKVYQQCYCGAKNCSGKLFTLRYMSQLIRVRCKAGTLRYELQPSSDISELVQKIVESVGADPSTITVSNQPRGEERKVAELRGRSLGALGLKHGDLLFVSYENEVPLPQQVTPVSNGESATSMLYPPPDVAHRPWELVKEDPVDDYWRKQDGKIPRSRDTRFCKHGANAMCDYCMPLEPYDAAYHTEQAIKHLSYHAYLHKLQPSKPASSSSTAALPPLESLSYKVKDPCPNGRHPLWPAGICSSCQPSAITLQPQPFRMVDHLELATHTIVDRFLDVWRRTGTQRFGWLIGRYEPYDKVPMGIKAVVEAIHEPPQEGELDGLTLGLPWEDEGKIRKLAAQAATPLTIVGYIFTDLDPSEEDRTKNVYKRHPGSFFLSSLEAIFAATLQLQNPTASRSSTTGKFSSRLVTAIATATEEGGIDISAYQVSEQACAMVDADMIEASVDPGIVRVKEEDRSENAARYVPDVFFRYKNEYGIDVQKSAKPCFPVEYLLVNVTHGFPQNPSPLILSQNFPIENRPGLENQDIQRILIEMSKLKAPKVTSDISFARKEPALFRQIVEYLSDWHLVVFLQTTGLFTEDGLKLLMRAVSSTNPGDPQNFYELFKTGSWETLMTFTRENAPSEQPSTHPVVDTEMDELPQEIRDQIAAMGGQVDTAETSSGARVCPHCTFENNHGGSDCEHEVQQPLSLLEGSKRRFLKMPSMTNFSEKCSSFGVWFAQSCVHMTNSNGTFSARSSRRLARALAADEASIALRVLGGSIISLGAELAYLALMRPIDMLATVSEAADIDIAFGPEEHIAPSVAQELSYWEKVVFSFDMDRDPGGSSSSGMDAHERSSSKDKRRQEGGLVPSSSDTASSGSGPSQASPLQRLDYNNQTGAQFHPHMPGGTNQPPNPQLTQFGGLDPYTLAHLAALSALTVPQNSANSQPNVADPLAIIRHMQGLLYPYGNTGIPVPLLGMPQGYPPAPLTNSAQVPTNNSAGRTTPANTVGQHWPPQLPGTNHPSLPPIDPSLAGQLPHLSSLMFPGMFSPPPQAPGAGPSSVSSITTSRQGSSDTSPSPTSPMSPGASRGQQATGMDEVAVTEDKRRRNTLASELEARADDLEREAAELRRENGWLKEMLIMKGRSLREPDSAARADGGEEGEESPGDSEGEEDLPDASSVNSAKGKGKGKAT